MWRSWTLVLAVFCWTAAIRSLPLPEIKEIVTMELIRHHEDHRVRRVAGESDMPDVIVMKFTLAGDDVILRLRRVPYLPVFLVMGNATEQWHQIPEDSSVYTDQTRFATFIISRSESQEFLLTGNMKHQGRPLSVSPRRSERSTQNEHVVSDLNLDGLDFGHDDIKLPDTDDDEVLNLQFTTHDENPEPGKKMAAPTIHTIETSFVVDYMDYLNWLKRYPSSTINQILEYYTYIAEEMNMIYSSVKEINSLIDIKVAVRGVFVLQDPPHSYVGFQGARKQVIRDTSYLTAFSQWIKSNNFVKVSDHYMAFTGYRLVGDKNQDLGGVAYIGEVCNGPFSISVVRNTFRASVGRAAAHELGHSLNADHDENSTLCKDAQLNVMVSHTLPYGDISPNANHKSIFDFSTCSVESISKYLARQTCTLPSQTTTPDSPPQPDGPYIKNRDLQCKVATSFMDSIYSMDQIEADICFGMSCTEPSGNKFSILPFEGTPCGHGKVCQQGECIADN